MRVQAVEHRVEELPRALQRLLDVPPLGDVDDIDQPPGATVGARQSHRFGQDPTASAVGAHHLEFALQRCAFVEEGAVALQNLGVLFGRKDQCERVADQFVAPPAVDRAVGRFTSTNRPSWSMTAMPIGDWRMNLAQQSSGAVVGGDRPRGNPRGPVSICMVAVVPEGE